VTPSLAVFEAAMWVKSMYITKSWFKTRKKYKIWKSKEFLHKSPSNRWFRNGIHFVKASWCQRKRSHHLPYL